VIPVGIAAICVGFVLKSAGTQAGPADTALPGPSISVFGTIHPDIFRLRTPLGSGHLSERVRVASLEPQIRFDAPPDRSLRFGVPEPIVRGVARGAFRRAG
jgi:hypothetical protein